MILKFVDCRRLWRAAENCNVFRRRMERKAEKSGRGGILYGKGTAILLQK